IDATAIAAAGAYALTASQVDVSDPDAGDRWIDEVLAIGGIEVLVNNAGTSGPTALIEDVDLADWDRCTAVGLTRHYRPCARVAPEMKARGHGSIINISSTAGTYGIGMRAP